MSEGDKKDKNTVRIIVVGSNSKIGELTINHIGSQSARPPNYSGASDFAYPQLVHDLGKRNIDLKERIQSIVQREAEKTPDMASASAPAKTEHSKKPARKRSKKNNKPRHR